MKVKVFDEHFEKGFVTFNLSLRQWLTLKIQGEVYVYHAGKNGWKGELPFYIIRCKTHGYFLDYPQGFPRHNQGFTCPFCLAEIRRDVK